MPRKLRVEFPGAIYHVLNRGNYREPIFGTLGARQAFEECLFEACKRSGWRLHAFVIMGNHYHLALETPFGNLATGMQWLQATFANRFNRLRGEHGHLFQGRYKSILVKRGEWLGTLCHYIHLNPARAQLVPPLHLADYRHSSLWYLHHPSHRPDFLVSHTALNQAGPLVDFPAGWRAYVDFLASKLGQSEPGPLGADALSLGWAPGGPEYQRELAQTREVTAETRAWDLHGAREVREEKWRRAFAQLRSQVPAEELANPRGTAPWRIRIAVAMKATTDADNRWLAQQLGIRSPRYLAKIISAARKR